MDAAKSVSEPLHGFMIDSVRLVRRCNKPDRKEFLKISTATAVGFAVMGFIGFFVRLIHIPVNSILLGPEMLRVLGQHSLEECFK